MATNKESSWIKNNLFCPKQSNNKEINLWQSGKQAVVSVLIEFSYGMFPVPDESFIKCMVPRTEPW